MSRSDAAWSFGGREAVVNLSKNRYEARPEAVEGESQESIVRRDAAGDPGGVVQGPGGDPTVGQRQEADAMSTRELHVATETAPRMRSEHLLREDRANLLRYMTLMRVAEERALTLYRQGKVPGSFYDGRGQEAISVGSSFVLGPRDRLCILHRDLGRALRARRHPGALPREFHGARRRRHRRPRRQHALRRSPPRMRRDGLDAARHGIGRERPRALVQDAPRAARRDDVLRRGLHRQRPVARGDELRRHPPAAGGVPAREQQVRVLDADRAGVRGRPGGPCGRLRVPGRARRRKRRRDGVRGHPGRRRARAPW